MTAGRAGSVSAAGALGALCEDWPLFEVSAVSVSPVGREEAGGGVDCGDCASAPESAAGSDWAAGACDAGEEQLASASAHVPTPARRTAGFFMDIVHPSVISGELRR